MSTHDRRIAQMTFASVYPMYVAKVKRKGRTEKELDQVIKWLTGFDNEKLQGLIEANVTFEIFKQAFFTDPVNGIDRIFPGVMIYFAQLFHSGIFTGADQFFPDQLM